MKNIFKKELEKIPETPSIIDQLEPKIANLEAQASELHGRIRATVYIPDKEVLMSKRAKIIEELNDLKLKQTEQKQNQCIKDLDQLFHTHKNSLVIEVNGRRLQLTEDLTIPIVYRPCNHKQPLHIKELLRFQRSVKLESVLLAKWNGMLNGNISLEARFNCQRCREEIETRFRKTRRRKENETVGKSIVTLRKL